MLSRYRAAITALAFFAVAGAGRVPAHPVTLGAESRLWIEGKSTVRNWSCQATAIEAEIEAEGTTVVVGVLKGQEEVASATLRFPVAKLDCANGTMNKHMLKALNVTVHPAITFALASYDLSATTPVKGVLQGTLTINGETKPITFPAEFTAAGGALRVTGSYALKMTEWQVIPPKLMLGALKVNEMVTVQFDLQLQP